MLTIMKHKVTLTTRQGKNQFSLTQYVIYASVPKVEWIYESKGNSS